MAPDAVERRVAAILCVDAGSDGPLAAGDEGATARALDECRERMSPLVRRLGGRSAPALGDRLLAEFPSAADAVVCAVEIQRELALQRTPPPDERRPRLRIGIHLGDIVVHGSRIAGEGVDVATAIGRLAEPSGICVASAIFEQVQDRVSYAFDDLGEHALEDIPKPVRVYRVDTGTPPAASAERARAALPRWMAWAALAALAASAVVSAWLILTGG